MSQFKWSGKRMMVLGSYGFLGRNFVEALQTSGVAEIVRPRHRECDLRDQVEVADMFAYAGKLDVIVNMAGLVGGIQANLDRPADFCLDNLMIGAHAMFEAQRVGVQKFVAVGAGCGYPEDAPIPTKEADFWNGYPQEASAPYSLAKRMLIVQAEALWAQHRFSTVVGIPGNVYGRWDRFDTNHGHVIPSLVCKFVEGAQQAANVVVWGKGDTTRDFVYAADVCEGLMLAAEAYDKPELVNLSSGVESSMREVVDALVKITGFKNRVVWDTIRPTGQARRCFDVTKAKRDFGFVAKTSLFEGLGLTVDWFKETRGKRE